MTELGAWGSPEWVWPAAALLAVAAVAVAWSYWRSGASGGVRALAAGLKAAGLAALAFALADPLLSGVRPRRGANIFAIVADDSQSMQIQDARARASRGELMQRMLLAETPWQTRLGQDFDVRRLAFSTQLRAVDDFSALSFDGVGTSLSTTVDSLARRFRGLPVAGVLLLTDGNATDELSLELPWGDLPPIFPVATGDDDELRDVSVERVSATETNFETAPVTIRADVRSIGYDGAPVIVALYDEHGETVATRTAQPEADGALASVRFKLRPETAGLSFYSVGACSQCEADEVAVDAPERKADEATLANNRRLVAIDRGGGPYRVLYVSGRPNWEFKFLRRALDADDQLELIGLIRIAKREAKFSFRRRGDDSANQLYQGFDNPDADAAETYDEPVLVRLGTEDEHELQGGFPRTADELYRYDALVLDDLEAGFFTQDQLTLIDDFVSRRGGGLLMLGGVESLAGGDYRRTPVGDALPVYLDGPSSGAPGDGEYRLSLTREGWLEPWVRLRGTEPEDRRRLAAMAPFQIVNPVGEIKPGATVLAQAVDDRTGKAYPALVAQRYGRGRSAAIMFGDLWRWAIRRQNETDDDLGKAWRQTVRWLVGDVPQRVEADVQAGGLGGGGAAAGSVVLRVRVRDAEYLPLDNAEVTIRVATPDGREIELEAQASDMEAGSYAATLVPREPGAYRAEVAVTAPDGSEVGTREIGWAAQPLADEFNRLAPNRELLAELAAKTKGEVIDADDLDDFVASLDSRSAPITEPWTRPLWHHPLFFVAAIACLAGEWGLRRWKGLA
jgi:hypothetical protein